MPSPGNVQLCEGTLTALVPRLEMEDSGSEESIGSKMETGAAVSVS